MNTVVGNFSSAHPAVAKVMITAVETIPIHVPFRVPFRIASGAARPISEAVIVRIHTTEGVVGIGETQAWRRQGSVETLKSLKCAIDDHLAPRMVGRSPFDMAAIMADLDEALYSSLYAKAAISDALYDLQGKLLDVPVYVLLGGKCRDRVGACAVLMIKDQIEETLKNAQTFHERGFRSFTIKIGVDPKGDLINVRELRKRFPDTILRVDANAVMGYDDALTLLKKIEPYDIDAAEQMIALWDVDGMASLARHVSIPLMADECVSSDHDLLRVIRTRAATVMQSKVAKNGGIWHSRKLWIIAEAAGMRIYPGNHPSTSVATASVAHLAAAWAGPLLDGPFAVGISGALGADIVTEPLKVENGAVVVPDGPGLGVTLDEGALKSMRQDI
jgi:L-alanine-DL-glutamate epimerase-like enolase superfamily enzyme